MNYVIGIFLILHGLVHLLYVGHARKLFELTPGFVWPQQSWLLSKRLNAEGIVKLTTVTFAVIAAGFVLGGTRLMLGWGESYPEVGVSAIMSILLYATLWDGSRKALANQGGFAVLFDVAIVAFVFA